MQIPNRRFTLEQEAAHKFVLLSRFPTRPRSYGCSCGRWQMDEPAVGAYGHVTPRAIIARVKTGHHLHLLYATGKSPLNRAEKD
jgi:hypothetical protein